MDTRLLIIRAITLLKLESDLPENTENSAELVKELVGKLVLPDAVNTDRTREVLAGLNNIALKMAENPVDHLYDKDSLKQEVMIACKDQNVLYNGFQQVIDSDFDVERLRRTIANTRRELGEYIQRESIVEAIRQKYRDILKGDPQWRKHVEELLTALEVVQDNRDDQQKVDPDAVDFNDDERLTEVYKEAEDEITGSRILKSGWQGLNRMLGHHQGFRVGDFLLFLALQFNFKSGFCLNLFRQLVTYNDAFTTNPDKKPLAIHISFENHLRDNMAQIYDQILLQETGPEDFAKNERPDNETISKKVKEKMMSRGWNIVMLRRDPTDFGYRDLFDLIMKYEAQGYEVVICCVDYVNMMSKKGCLKGMIGGATGMDVRDLFRRIRNFFSKRNTFFFTPHQLSTKAKMLLTSGVEDFVKHVAHKGMTDGCGTIDQEVDLEINGHVERPGNGAYLTLMRGKHRKSGPETPEEDQYVILPFTKYGIMDDLDKEDTSLRKLPGGRGSAILGW